MGQQVLVQLTKTAKRSYLKMQHASEICEGKGDVTNSAVVQFRDLNMILEETIPADPFSKQRALAGYFSIVFEVAQDGICVCYLGLPKEFRVVVLYIAEMSQRDTTDRDSYGLIVGMAQSGRLTEALSVLGVSIPEKTSNAPSYLH
ncbi:MAG: hypothetical protein WCA19_11445 [Candidatus Acidiferrales bacterium]